MLNSKSFSIPNWLDLEGYRLPVIVTRRKPTCWHSGEIGHLSAICPGKKASLKKPNHSRNAPPPVAAKGEKEVHVILPTVRTSGPNLIGEKGTVSLPLRLLRSPPRSQRWSG